MGGMSFLCFPFPLLKPTGTILALWVVPYSPSALLQLASICQKEAYTLVWHPDFCCRCQGTLLQNPALEASGTYAHKSHRTIANRERVLK